MNTNIFSSLINKIYNLKNKNNWLKPSYAQCGEDLIIKFIFNQLGISKPSYIDIGAHHPFFLSNTAIFNNIGCRGINIEPDPYFFKQFVKHRKKDINLNVGVGEKNGSANFYIISDRTLNTFSKEEAEKYKNEGDFKVIDIINIEVMTIDLIIEKYALGEFPNFLNIDAEGIDELIIKSLDFTKNAPIVICIETISFSTSRNGIKNNALIEYIINRGYLVYADTYINTIFVKKDVWLNN